MDELLSKENLEYRARAREVADTVVRKVAAHYDREQSYPWEVLEALKKAELTGVWIPKEYGGPGGGLLNLCIVVEELSKACGGVGVAYAVNALGSFPIITGASEEQKHAWLPAIARGEKLIAFGLSEKDAGSDAGSLQCKAIRDGDHYVVNGQKKWNTNGGVAHHYTVYCQTNPDKGIRGISALMIEKGTPGFTIPKVEDKMGIRCVPVVELDFKDVRVPASNLIGKEGGGFRNAMSTLDLARPGVASQAVGLAAGATRLALEYASQRKQFGQSIVSFQAIQFMLADMDVQTEVARQMVYNAAKVVDQVTEKLTKLEGIAGAGGPAGFSKYSAISKVFATDIAMKVTTDAVQIFGGNGYMKDFPIEKYMRDAKITQIYEGTNQIQRLVIGRAMLRELGGTGAA
ncbi:MAG: acyl-CoA dehydrogenase family protein [Candidatus Eisenbacteria bacterium]